MAENPENLSGTPEPTPGATGDAASNAFSQDELDALMQQMSSLQTEAAQAKPAAAPAAKPEPVAAAETPVAAAPAEPPIDEATFSAAQDEVDALAAEMAAALGMEAQAAEAAKAAPPAPKASPAVTKSAKVIGADVAMAPEDAVAFAAPELKTAPPPAPGNLELLDDVQLDVQIELGRALMYIEDVLRLGAGSVVELNKLAGDPVDIYANGRLVAHGEVLVLNDNFCVRINQIHSPVPELAASA